MSTRLTSQPPTPCLDDIVAKNVELVRDIESASHKGRSTGQVISDAIAGFCGSTTFIWAHCVWFGFWLVWNTSHMVPKRLAFDPAPFAILTLIVSLEAIFLSTFILISQNRQQLINDERTHLDLQINLLAEQETSHMLALLIEIREHLGIRSKADVDADDLRALGEETDVRKVIDHLKDNVDSLRGK